ncbi:hypothetical protein OF83DRAFT_1288808 [Amylostereum chailletii]|nr:hypothetical protein OF83DRAFT_1288808 [Amylostereum chailletii]
MPNTVVAQPPPAYTHHSSPSLAVPSTGSLQELDDIQRRSSQAQLDPLHVRGPAAGAPPRVLGPIVGRLSLSSLYEGISGSWRIDPSMPPPPPGILAEVLQAFVQRRRRRETRRARLSDGLQTGGVEPNVSFDSLQGAIVADLGFVGKYPTKSTVRATTRNGNVFIDLFEKSPGQIVDIEVYSSRGNSTLLLPPTFSGTVDIHTRHGKIDLLPGLSRHARVISSSRHDIRILVDRVGDQPAMGGTSLQHADVARLASRMGNFRVGLSVEDAGKSGA